MKFPRLTAQDLFAVGLVIIGAGLRIARDRGWLPLPPNFAPITGLAIFSGLYLPRRTTFVIPLAAMLISDLIIGFYSLPIMIAVYASFGLSNFLGRRLRRRVTVRRLGGVTLLSSVMFFVVTNAAVWAFTTIYQHSLAGLLNAYLAGWPFFRNTVMGDLFFTGLFTGIYQLVVIYYRRRRVVASSVIHG